jgi:hypothetical protein
VTLMVQLVPAGSDIPQLLEGVKSAALVPEVPTLVMLSAAVPVLVNVSDWLALAMPTVWLPKLTLAGARLAAGVPAPVPLRVIPWGLLAALSAIVRVAERVPTALGLNATLTVQFAP